MVQVVAYLGNQLGGWAGSAVSTIAFLIPSVMVMLVLSYGYAYAAALPAVSFVRRGVLAAVVGLLLLTTYRLGTPVLATPLAIGLALAAFLAGAALHINAVWIVFAAGVIGVLAGRR